MEDLYRITTEAQLREIIPAPKNPLVQKMIFSYIDEYARNFIENSPLIVLASTDQTGQLDISPKGDAPGFVQVENKKTILIPERPGNKVAMSFRNILQRPFVSILFLIPGVLETLRINGSAELTREPSLLQSLAAQEKPALLVTRVTVKECFLHCGKALIRSRLWKKDSWPKGFRANIGKQLAKKLEKNDDVASEIEAQLQEDYQSGLY